MQLATQLRLAMGIAFFVALLMAFLLGATLHSWVERRTAAVLWFLVGTTRRRTRSSRANIITLKPRKKSRDKS